MRIEIYPDTASASQRAAALIAQCAAQSVAERGRFVMALSGGTEPWNAFRLLAREPLPWAGIQVLQVDERVAPEGHEDRNYTHLCRSLIDRVPLPDANVHPMPVNEQDLPQAAERYAALLTKLTGSRPGIDLVHLGLGQDGHTASLAPNEPVVEILDREVAVTNEFRGLRRMTLTFAAINRARHIVWLVVGEAKSAALARLLTGHSKDPAGRVKEENATLIADRAAARNLRAVC